MKRWLWYVAAVVAVAAIGGMPFSGTDVAELQPVELIRVSRSLGTVRVETDTGAFGAGTDLRGAFSDMMETSTGNIFLETADHLLISPAAVDLLPELADRLRPACGICMENGTADLEQAAAYLKTHEPDATLRDIRAGAAAIPSLLVREGRMYLVS